MFPYGLYGPKGPDESLMMVMMIIALGSLFGFLGSWREVVFFSRTLDLNLFS